MTELKLVDLPLLSTILAGAWFSLELRSHCIGSQPFDDVLPPYGSAALVDAT